MFKGLFGLLLTSLLTAGWTVIHGYTEDFVVDNGVLVSVNDKTNYSLRIYAEKGVTSIAEHAFDDCHFVTMMISTTVTEINATFPTELTTIEFTGSKEDISFAIPEELQWWNTLTMKDSSITGKNISVQI